MAAIPPLSTGAGPGTGLVRQGADAAGQARAAAQRAFFQAALGRAQASTAIAPAAGRQTPATQPVVQTAAAPEPTPIDRIPRPGTLLNIVV